MKDIYRKDGIQIINGDCIDVMNLMANFKKEVNIVLTSPFYNTSKDRGTWSKDQKTHYGDNMDNKKTVLQVLQDCIDELEKMTPEEFKQRQKELGLDKIKYDPSKYESDDFEILLPCEVEPVQVVINGEIWELRKNFYTYEELCELIDQKPMGQTIVYSGKVGKDLHRQGFINPGQAFTPFQGARINIDMTTNA